LLDEGLELKDFKPAGTLAVSRKDFRNLIVSRMAFWNPMVSAVRKAPERARTVLSRPLRPSPRSTRRA